MAEYAYVLSPNKLKRFMGHMQTAGVPSKVTQKYLEKVGFPSKNDRLIIAAMKQIRFLDASGHPTESWRQYRDKNAAPGVLAAALREGYQDLFETYPDANRKDVEALRNYFGANTDVGEKALASIVTTFRTLCEFADFSKGVATPKGADRKGGDHTTDLKTVLSRRGHSDGLTLNINIQITVPETDDPDIYDRFFAAMKRNLLDESE